jgi:hypothetical protein
MLTQIAPNLRDRLLIRFKGKNARVKSEKQARGALNQGATKDVAQIVNSLFAKAHVDCVVTFLIPEVMGMCA